MLAVNRYARIIASVLDRWTRCGEERTCRRQKVASREQSAGANFEFRILDFESLVALN